MGSIEDLSAASNPMGRVGQMQELRNLAVFLMADGVDYLTGETIAIDGASFLAGGGISRNSRGWVIRIGTISAT